MTIEAEWKQIASGMLNVIEKKEPSKQIGDFTMHVLKQLGIKAILPTVPSFPTDPFTILTFPSYIKFVDLLMARL